MNSGFQILHIAGDEIRAKLGLRVFRSELDKLLLAGRIGMGSTRNPNDALQSGFLAVLDCELVLQNNQ